MSYQRPIEPGKPTGAKTRLPGILLVGALVLLLAYVTYNTVTGQHGSSTGPAVGTPMIQFAAPLVASGLEGDVNVTQLSQATATAKAACSVVGPGVLNSCRLVRGHPAALVFIDDSDGGCADTLDRVIAAAATYPRIRVAGIVIAGDRSAARALAARHRWKVALANDRDGALANLYGVAVCPQIVYLKPGGTVAGVGIGQVNASQLKARFGELSGGK